MGLTLFKDLKVCHRDEGLYICLQDGPHPRNCVEDPQLSAILNWLAI
jgi:hypothetical protein